MWVGVSCGNRKDGLPRIEHLRRVPAAVRFLSIEPLLEDLGELDLRGIDWVICGGESGQRARPMHPAWVRNVRDQCVAQGVPFFFKQWGTWLPRQQRPDMVIRGHGWGVLCEDGVYFQTATCWNGHDDDGVGDECIVARVGKKRAGNVLDGRTWAGWPTPRGSVAAAPAEAHP